MPGSTPVYGIAYPCSGDTINPTLFQDYAESVQDALTEVSNLADQLLNPPAVLVRQIGGGQSIAAGVTTVATYTVITYDTAAMFNLATPTTVTITQPGTYVANYRLRLFAFPTTLNSFRGAILVNGVEVAYNKSDESTGAFNVDTPMWISAMLPSLVAGDTITTNALFVGTGNMQIEPYLAVTRFSIV